MEKHTHWLLCDLRSQIKLSLLRLGSHWTHSAQTEALVGEINTWSTCPSGVVLSSLSSVEPEQPFFTLFGLSCRDKNKETEWINKRKRNSFSCLLRGKNLSRCTCIKIPHRWEGLTGKKKQPWADVMFCVGVTGTVCTINVLEMCQRIILYLYNGIYCPWRQNMVSEQPTGTLCWLLVCTFIMTLWKTQKQTNYINSQHDSDESEHDLHLSSLNIGLCISVSFTASPIKLPQTELKPLWIYDLHLECLIIKMHSFSALPETM